MNSLKHSLRSSSQVHCTHGNRQVLSRQQNLSAVPQHQVCNLHHYAITVSHLPSSYMNCNRPCLVSSMTATMQPSSSRSRPLRGCVTCYTTSICPSVQLPRKLKLIDRNSESPCTTDITSFGNVYSFQVTA